MNNVKHQWFSFYTDVFVRFCSEGYCSTWRMVACNRLEMLRTSQSSQSVTVNGYRNALLLCKLLLCKWDHKTKHEIAPKSAVKKQSFPWTFIGTCCCDAVPPHRHRRQWKYTLNNLQCSRLLRNIDLSFDLQIFLNLLVTGLLEIAHV